MKAEGSNEVAKDAVPGLKGGVPIISSKQIGAIPFLEDNESFQDLLAFTGPAPEVFYPALPRKTLILRETLASLYLSMENLMF